VLDVTSRLPVICARCHEPAPVMINSPKGALDTVRAYSSHPQRIVAVT
jgi:hypothetical protein